MKKLAIIGTKEFSEQIIHFAKRTGEYEFVGYFDDLLPEGSSINGKPVFGKVENAISFYKNGIFDFVFIGVGYTRFDLREYYYNLLKGKVPFANIIMPNVNIDPNVMLGEGIYIGERCFIGENCQIQNNVFIHSDSTIGHDNIISEHTYISGRDYLAGYVHIGRKNFIGLNVCIADHINLVDDVWISLGCTVGKSIKTPGKYLSNSIILTRVE